MLRVDHTTNFLSSKCVPGIGFNFVLHYMYIYFFFDFHKSNNFVNTHVQDVRTCLQENYFYFDFDKLKY